MIVADDGSHDRTADIAEDAGAIVLRLPSRQGTGAVGGRACGGARPSPALRRRPRRRPGPLAASGADSTIAVVRRRPGGGFGIAKSAARALIRLARGLRRARAALGPAGAAHRRARAACFPLAPGFGCETRMTIDAARAGLASRRSSSTLDHRATGRDLRGFAHRGRQLARRCCSLPARCASTTAACACRSSAGRRRRAARRRAVAAIGLADDPWSGPERGFRAHLRAGARPAC